MMNKDGRPKGWFNLAQGAVYLREVSRYRQGTVVEVGTWLGRSTSFIAHRCRELGHRLYCVDTWEGSHDATGSLARQFDVFAAFEENLKHLDIADVVTPVRKSSIDAAKQFEDGSVDLVMIDADHQYASVKADIEAWLPKVASGGGTLMGHDFTPKMWPGVVRAVRERWPNVHHEHGLWIVRL